MAIESSRVTADVIEVQEYPHRAQAYGVRGVPMTVINDRVFFTGAVPESVFLQRVLEAVDAETSDELQHQSEPGQSTSLV